MHSCLVPRQSFRNTLRLDNVSFVTRLRDRAGSCAGLSSVVILVVMVMEDEEDFSFQFVECFLEVGSTVLKEAGA